MWNVEHSSGAVRAVCDIQIDCRWGGGGGGAGTPKLTWKKLTKKDCHEWTRQLTLKKGAPGDQV